MKNILCVLGVCLAITLSGCAKDTRQAAAVSAANGSSLPKSTAIRATTQAQWHSQIRADLKRHMRNRRNLFRYAQVVSDPSVSRGPGNTPYLSVETAPELKPTHRPEGIVTVYLILNRQGKVVRSGVRKSSGHEVLDRGVRQVLGQKRQYPQPPASLEGDRFKFIIPMAFEFPPDPEGEVQPPMYPSSGSFQ